MKVEEGACEVIREKSKAQEFGRERSRLLLAGTAVFTLAAQ